MKNIVLILILIIVSGLESFAGEKFFTRTGHIYIITSTPLLDLEADNNQVASILDVDSGEMVFSLLMKSFIWEEALAQEHFNENYVESDKFPKAKFKGKITNIKDLDFGKNGKNKVKISGKLSIHGKTHKVKTIGTIEVKDGKLIGYAKFKINIFDYDIQIPNIVRDKVNNIIPITINIIWKPYK